MTERRAELAAALTEVRERISRAAAAAGRDDPITLVVVTKRFPASDVDLLAGLGVTDIGENKEQELGRKLPDVGSRDRLTVHYVGQLQSNKAAAVARGADVVHSLDRAKLVGRLAGAERTTPLKVLVQVSLDGEAGRGGVEPAGLDDLVDEVAGTDGLDFKGLMAVAPLGVDPDRAFGRLAELHAGVRDRHTGATWLSAGMSGDLEAAIRHGATHLRVGTAILGTRLSLG